MLKAQLEISLLIERLAMFERQRGTLQAQINSLLYRAPDTPVDGTLAYQPAVLTQSLDALRALAQEHYPALKRDERAIDRGQQALALAKRQVLPDFAVNFTSQRFVGNMPWMYGVDFMVKVPLYWWRKQRPDDCGSGRCAAHHYGVVPADLHARSARRAALQAAGLHEDDRVVRLPGVANAWTMPIKARVDMLSTGIRTPVGIKRIFLMSMVFHARDCR